MLDAEKDYGSPASWSDGTASVSPAMKFDLPREIGVTAGRAGKGSVTLALQNGSRVTNCTYRSRGDDDGDRSEERSDRRKTYRLEHCDRHSDGDDVSATDFTLHVVDGDASDPAGKTAVEVVLSEERPCKGDPDAGTVAPIDAGPGPVSTCTAAQCDDGNPCTADSCTASGACAHAPVADGTSCYNGDLCVFSNSETCTAGVCGAGVPDCGGAECVSSACTSSTGQCLPAPAGTPCSSGACDGNYSCVAGTAATAVTFLPPLCPPQTTSECSAKTCTYVPGTANCSCAPLAFGTPCSTGICDGANNCVPQGSPSDAGTGAAVMVSASCPLPTACLQPGALDLAAGASACAYIDLPSGTACGTATCNGAGTCGP